jgi:hypothetical protein
MPLYQFAIVCLLGFIGFCSTLLLIIRVLLPRHDYRDSQAGRDRRVKGAGSSAEGSPHSCGPQSRLGRAADYVTDLPACSRHIEPRVRRPREREQEGVRR